MSRRPHLGVSAANPVADAAGTGRPGGPVVVRAAGPDDSERIVDLLEQLGYAVDVATLTGRLPADDGLGDAAWVAVSAMEGSDRGSIVGFAAGHRFRPFELSAPVSELTALVVDEGSRRSGVGLELVSAFERWSAEAGCLRASVATSFARSGAHRFYESLGYGRLARKYERDPRDVV